MTDGNKTLEISLDRARLDIDDMIMMRLDEEAQKRDPIR